MCLVSLSYTVADHYLIKIAFFCRDVGLNSYGLPHSDNRALSLLLNDT